MTEIIKGISEVPRDIRREVLSEFIGSCKQFHKIAFYQWRKKFKAKVKKLNTEELNENINKTILFIFKNQKLELCPINYPKTTVTQEFIAKFKNSFLAPLHIHITTFKKIGIHDPFPNE